MFLGIEKEYDKKIYLLRLLLFLIDLKSTIMT